MSETITIVDYHAGNLTSVRLALEKLDSACVVTSDPDAVAAASRLVFPGVGAATAAMDTLRALGLVEALRAYAETGRPMLGICLGAQIVLESSEEVDTPCMGLIRGRATRLDVPAEAKVPHMGWNTVEQVLPHAIWRDVEGGAQFYFVHSYAPSPADGSVVIGRTDYFGAFVSAIARDNVVACQFHPERSGRVGLKLLSNFLAWNP